MSRPLPATVVLCAIALALASSAPAQPQAGRGAAPAVAQTPLVIAREDGERRIRKYKGVTDLFILKVDRRNGGSPHLVMGYEDIPPGGVIPPHRHFNADEIIFVHKGRGTVENGAIRSEFGEGATVYIPRDTRITLRNTGDGPLSIAFIFSHPGFEDLMREVSAPEGEEFVPLTREQLDAIRARHRSHVEYEPRP